MVNQESHFQAINGPLISVSQLHKLSCDERLVVLHTSMSNPVTGQAEDEPEGYILNARHFDFENVFCDTASPLPHTMPHADKFEKEAQKLGINQDSIIVVYDDIGIYSAPRVWWMFKTMGHISVYVLNGGLPQWQKQNLPVSASKQQMSSGNFKAHLQDHRLINSQQILQRLQDEQLAILDARSVERFTKQAPEPRAGVRSGHIPNSFNLPFHSVLDDGKLLDESALKTIFSQVLPKEVDELSFSCGSGVTACILALAAQVAGYSNLSVYDGSWTEWGSNTQLPIE